ncbi:MAG: Gfo/Idh/MocA family protein [Verrucomicrobiales bacterium]
MLKVALIGCGKIADQHVQAIGRLEGSRVVAVCDREPLMAKQLAIRFGIPGVFSDVGEMMREARPDVVHISTPPQSHFPLACQCLEAGVHVYLEKPFTVTATEAEQVVTLAQEKGKLITAGHNLQFTPEMLAMRKLAGTGYLGGKPVHLESHFSYSLEDTSYIGPVLGSPNHWVRQLPGQLFHNILSHGIAKLAEFLGDDTAVLHASAHQSPRLAALGGQEVKDELRVLIRDATGTTAYFCFSTQLRPGRNSFLVCGPAQSLTVDHASGSIVQHQNKSAKSYFTFVLPPIRLAVEWLKNALRNAWNIARWRLHQDAGMKELIGQFHQAVRTGGPPPIPYREILLTARIMDEIFAQITAPAAGER